MRRRAIGGLAAAAPLLFLVLSACADDGASEAPLGPSVPEQVLMEAGNGHFRFLQPLGGGGNRDTGQFNPRLSPVVEVCRLGGVGQPSESTPCVELVARFTTDGADPIDVDVRREMYSVSWDLSDHDVEAGSYRISIRTAASDGPNTLLGIADVAVVASGGRGRSAARPGMHTLTDRQTLPIKFRIEEGALCAPGVDCFEGAVGPAGGTFVTAGLLAGAQFPADALADTRTLVIEQVNADDVPFCVPTHNPQYEGCYRFRLEPALEPGESFAAEVVVGVCLDPAAFAFEDELELQKWDEVDPSSLQSLPRREIDFLECGDFSASVEAPTGFLARLAHGGARLLGPVVRLLGPQPLYAGRSPFGGGLNDFSLIGWVRPLALEVVAGDGQTACVGASVEQDPTLRVTALLTGAPLSGVPLAFGATVGGGSAFPALTTTDGGGLASTEWTLGLDAGANVLQVDGRNPLTGWPQWTAAPPVWGSTTISATAAPAAGFEATFLTPFTDVHFGSEGYASRLHPVMELCALDDAGSCVGEVVTYDDFAESAQRRAYQTFWTPPFLAPGTVYRLTIVVEGRAAGSARVTADEALAGDDVLLVKPFRGFTMKVDVVPADGCVD